MRSIEYENWKAIPTTTSFCFDDVTGCKTEVGGSEKFSIVFHQLLSHVAGHRRGWWTLKPPNRDDEPKNEIYSIYWIWNSTLYFWHIYYLCKSTKQKKCFIGIKNERQRSDRYLFVPAVPHLSPNPEGWNGVASCDLNLSLQLTAYFAKRYLSPSSDKLWVGWCALPFFGGLSFPFRLPPISQAAVYWLTINPERCHSSL